MALNLDKHRAVPRTKAPDLSDRKRLVAKVPGLIMSGKGEKNVTTARNPGLS